MYRITVENAEKIKNILLYGYLDNKTIELEYKHINTKVRINGKSKNEKSSMFTDLDMDMYYFLNNLDEEDIHSCIYINNKKEKLYINIGQWGTYEYDIPNMHIALGTSTYKFGSAREYFSQLEISQALEDSNYIYLVKNITDLSGPGAISRLNTGLKSDKDRKHERRNILVNRLNCETKLYKDNKEKEWMVISKINKQDLNNEEKCNDIFYSIINDILNYSFTIEDIIAEDKLLATSK